MGKKSYKHPRQYTTETFKERLKEVYGDKFGIDFVEYNGAYEDVILVCPIHGKFKVRACSAARGAAKCPECSSIHRSVVQRIPYEPTRFGGISEEKAVEQFKYVKELDKRKRKLCKEHNIKLLYLKYDEDIGEFYKKLVGVE